MPDEKICVKDNGTGIPVIPLPPLEETLFEIAFDAMRPGDWSNCPYWISGKHHGVGVSCSNAVSSQFEVETKWDRYLWRLVCEKGVKQSGPEQVRKLHADEQNGTTITFTPDFTIFEPNAFDFNMLIERAQELAYLIPGLTMTVRDQRNEPHAEARFCHANGLTDLIEHLNRDTPPLHAIFTASRTYTLHPVRHFAESSQIKIEFAFQYSGTDKYHEHSYVNTVKTSPQSSHVMAFRDVFLDTINRYRKHRRSPRIEGGPLSWEEITPGLTVAISVMHEDPDYADAGIRSKVENLDLYGLVASLVYETLTIALQDDDNLRQAIYQKLQSNRSRLSQVED